MESKIKVQEKKGVSFVVEFYALGINGTRNGKTLKENTFKEMDSALLPVCKGWLGQNVCLKEKTPAGAPEAAIEENPPSDRS